MYSHVNAIEVSIWGRHVGTIAPKTSTHFRFEYDETFLHSGIEIAPLEMPLERGEFSFMLKEGGAWQLAPAYDLTGGVPPEAPAGDARRDWTNCHAMSINGKQSNITDDDLFAVAERYSIGSAKRILGDIRRIFS